MSRHLKTEGFDIRYLKSDHSHTALENHCHSQVEMIAVVEGDVTVTLENTIYRVSDKQCLLIPPLQYHSITANRGRYERITALFELGAIPEALQEKWKQDGYNECVGYFPQAQAFKAVLEQNDPGFFSPLAESFMIQLLYECLHTQAVFNQENTNQLVRSAVEYIDRHIHQKILLEDITKHLLCSKSTFCHVFEKHMNISPKQYVLQKKLAMATQLLKQGLSPTAVSLGLGFENYSNFYRLYRKHYGASPMKYHLAKDKQM